MVSEMLMETKNSPVMNYEAISYEEQCYIYLPTLHAGGDSRKMDFPGSCAKIKRSSASYPFHLFRWGNNATGDNNIGTVMQRTSTCIISVLLPGILHEVGLMNIIGSRKGNG